MGSNRDYHFISLLITQCFGQSIVECLASGSLSRDPIQTRDSKEAQWFSAGHEFESVKYWHVLFASAINAFVMWGHVGPYRAILGQNSTSQPFLLTTMKTPENTRKQIRNLEQPRRPFPPSNATLLRKQCRHIRGLFPAPTIISGQHWIPQLFLPIARSQCAWDLSSSKFNLLRQLSTSFNQHRSSGSSYLWHSSPSAELSTPPPRHTKTFLISK